MTTLTYHHLSVVPDRERIHKSQPLAIAMTAGSNDGTLDNSNFQRLQFNRRTLTNQCRMTALNDFNHTHVYQYVLDTSLIHVYCYFVLLVTNGVCELKGTNHVFLLHLNASIIHHIRSHYYSTRPTKSKNLCNASV